MRGDRKLKFVTLRWLGFNISGDRSIYYSNNLCINSSFVKPEEELGYFFQQLQELCEELDQQLSQTGDNLLEINRNWGNTTIKHYAHNSSSGMASLVNALAQRRETSEETKPLKSPRLIEGDSKKLKNNLIAKGVPWAHLSLVSLKLRMA